MGKRIILSIFFSALLLLSPIQKASAALGNQGLIINGGASELRLKIGEKRQLFVRDGLTGIPLTTGITFYSDNDLIATIGEDSGILHAISKGTAHITIMSPGGRSARIKVIIEGDGKLSPLLFLLFLPPLLLLLRIKKR